MLVVEKVLIMEPLMKTLSCKVFWFFTKGANSL
jgi:hypothetical protein